MNKITIGQYIPGNSWIYKLDPRLKIAATFILMILIFLLPSLMTMASAFAILLLIFLTTRISLIRVIKGLKPLLFLIIFTSILQLMYNEGGNSLHTFYFQLTITHVGIILAMILFYTFTKKFIRYKTSYFLLLTLSIFTIQYLLRFDTFNLFNYSLEVFEQGLERASFIVVRMIFMITLTSLLTLSTTPMDINAGLQSIMRPLRIIKVPVDMLAIMLSLTLRFIPTLIFETDKIMKAQASRGVDFNEGKLKDKVMQIISLLVPLFVMSIKRSEDLANAMESRGFIIGARRTRLDELRFKFLDYFTLIIVVIMSLSILFVRFYVY